MLDLSRILYRYQTRQRGYNEIRLSEAFKEELDRLVTLCGDVEDRAVELRQGQLSLLEDFDRAADRAERALATGFYQNALNAINEATDALDKIHAFLDVYDRYEAARSAYATLNALIDDEPTRNLTTLRIIERLLHESYTHLMKEALRQAGFMARLCRQQVLDLLKQPEDAEVETRQLHEALEQLRQQFEAAVLWSPQDFRHDQVLAVVARLLDDRRLPLAESLIRDLEARVSPSSTFMREYERLQATNPDVDTLATAETLQRVVQTDSWQEGTTLLLQGALVDVWEGALIAEHATTAFSEINGEVTDRV